jgi:hypothetical protein
MTRKEAPATTARNATTRVTTRAGKDTSHHLAQKTSGHAAVRIVRASSGADRDWPAPAGLGYASDLPSHAPS